MCGVWVERTSFEVCVNHISHLFDRLQRLVMLVITRFFSVQTH